ncbi:hypothetical protein D9611_007182 [Ephemerocybe angulata]|uniref:Uncharacterized protein n=1 Tax=Ephemerocybe angulata TaxID=980116 RepID=A0A8H5EW01_9AGAR|nr:hypothetical protein D9611_007182 [Tulosesus angulatus]
MDLSSSAPRFPSHTVPNSFRPKIGFDRVGLLYKSRDLSLLLTSPELVSYPLLASQATFQHNHHSSALNASHYHFLLNPLFTAIYILKMVQASIIIVAFVAAVAPVMAAPAPQAPASYPRSLDNTLAADIDARDPRFSFKKAFHTLGRVAKTAGGIALKAAPLLLREDLSEFETRSLDDGAIGEVYIRDEDGTIYVRELDAEELSAALEARKLHFGRLLKKGLSVATKVSGGLSQFGLRELEDLELEARELGNEELAAEIEARKLRLGRLLKKGLGAARKGLSVAQKVSGGLSQFGLREFEDELEERESNGSLDELD